MFATSCFASGSPNPQLRAREGLKPTLPVVFLEIYIAVLGLSLRHGNARARPPDVPTFCPLHSWVAVFSSPHLILRHGENLQGNDSATHLTHSERCVF